MPAFVRTPLYSANDTSGTLIKVYDNSMTTLRSSISFGSQHPQQCYPRFKAVPFREHRQCRRQQQLRPRAAELHDVQAVAPVLLASAAAFSPVALATGAGIAVLGGALLIWRAVSGAMQEGDNGMASSEADAVPPKRRDPKNAVLVFGGTGKLGRLLVKKLIESGRDVVLAARSEEKAADVLAMLDLSGSEVTEGELRPEVFVQTGVDITDSSTLPVELLLGVAQIVSVVGPIFGRSPEGQMGYLDNMTSERVDATGVSNIAQLLSNLPASSGKVDEVLGMRSAEDMEKWQRLDDVIMGGQSNSELRLAEDGTGAVWDGTVRVEGGGFCGARSRSLSLNLGGYDGIAMRVRGDGQTYKLNLKTADQENTPESTYQAQFDTVAGEWSTVRLPWHEFVGVKRAQVDRNAPPVDPSTVRQLGLVLSRFEYNGFANQVFKAGPFSLEIDGGISAFEDPRPTIVMVSSAGVERNAVIGDDEEARKLDIPIVQLNPGGTLNHKYTGENAIRAAGLSYCVLRAVGLTNEEEDVKFMLEGSQGDQVSGKISRAEVADLIAAALSSSATVGKTLEVRRSEARDGRDRSMTGADTERMFLSIALDRHRPQRLLPPFPKAVPPPPPPSKERMEAILNDSRVKAASVGGRGGRVRDEKETKAADTFSVTDDGRKEISAPAPVQEEESVTAVEVEESNESVADETEAEEASGSAKEWIGNWRGKQPAAVE